MKPSENKNLKLSVIVTVVSGKNSMLACLEALCPQIDFESAEVIVPFDKWSQDVETLADDFPQVLFHFVEDLGMAAHSEITAHEHRLYDRRRAIGLQLARGEIVAMTEDHAIPAKNWVEKILEAHTQPFEIIGGAIENGVDRPLNWAWYYCDFGRYGRPITTSEITYVSDVNVSYKKKALDSVKKVWLEAYRETILHWTLQERGAQLRLNDSLVVYQHRPEMSLSNAFRERIAWGRVFAETRVAVCSLPKRLTYAAGTILLPPLLLFRVLQNMTKQKRTFKQISQTMPLAFFLLVGWSLGELLGYISGMPDVMANELEMAKHNYAEN